MPLPLKYVTIQPVTLCSAAFWQKSRPVNSQKRVDLRKLQSVTSFLPAPLPAKGVPMYTSQSSRPSTASTSTAKEPLTLPAAAMKKGQSSAPQA